MMLRRRNVTYSLIESLSPPDQKLDEDEAFHVETELRYAGYIEKERRTASRMGNMDNVLIPELFDYDAVKDMRAECRQKLLRFRPRSLGKRCAYRASPRRTFSFCGWQSRRSRLDGDTPQPIFYLLSPLPVSFLWDFTFSIMVYSFFRR